MWRPTLFDGIPSDGRTTENHIGVTGYPVLSKNGDCRGNCVPNGGNLAGEIFVRERVRVTGSETDTG